MTTQSILTILFIVAIINILFILALAIIGRTKYKNKRKIFDIFSKVFKIQAIIFLIVSIIQLVLFANIMNIIMASLNHANVLNAIVRILIPVFAVWSFIIGRGIENSNLIEE